MVASFHLSFSLHSQGWIMKMTKFQHVFLLNKGTHPIVLKMTSFSKETSEVALIRKLVVKLFSFYLHFSNHKSLETITTKTKNTYQKFMWIVLNYPFTSSSHAFELIFIKNSKWKYKNPQYFPSFKKDSTLSLTED